MSRIVRGVAAVLILLASTGCLRSEKHIEGVDRRLGMKKAHVQTRQTYDPIPPMGGDHAPYWLRCDIYDEAVPDEFAVHSMEHGAVWITYRPALPSEAVAKLRALQRIRGRYFLLSPYPGLPSPVVASAWGTQLRVDSADDERLAAFVRNYTERAPGIEKGAPCVDQGLTLAEARARQEEWAKASP